MGKGLLRGTIFILSIVIDDSTARPQPTRLLGPCCKFRLRYRESKRRRSPLACTTFFNFRLYPLHPTIVLPSTVLWVLSPAYFGEGDRRSTQPALSSASSCLRYRLG